MYKSLTGAEKVVMKAMWDSDHPLSLGETTKLLNESYGKNWKPQTVSTFIAKVVQKGFLKMVREGRRITYEILISLEEYRASEAREFVEFWDRGDVAEFLSSYFYGRKADAEEIDRLRKAVEDLAQK